MNYAEEQELELEALQSIFVHENELEVVDPQHFILRLLPFPDEEEENHVELHLDIRYPETYPEVVADVQVVKETSRGIITGESMLELITGENGIIASNLEENIGMAMIYPLAEVLQDWLRENNQKELTMHEEMLLREKDKKRGEGGAEGSEEDEEDEDDEPDQELDQKEWKGLDQKELCAVSERVNEETFLAWREKLDAEMIKLGLRDAKKTASTISGRQFYEALEKEQGGAGDSAKLTAAAGDDKEEDVDVDETLFAGDDEDVDLDDLDEDE